MEFDATDATCRALYPGDAEPIDKTLITVRAVQNRPLEIALHDCLQQPECLGYLLGLIVLYAASLHEHGTEASLSRQARVALVFDAVLAQDQFCNTRVEA